MYRLSLKTCFGSRGPAGARQVSIGAVSTLLKVALGATHRVASRTRCCRLGSTDRRSADLVVCDGEGVIQKRVARLNVSEQMAITISAPRHPRSPTLLIIMCMPHSALGSAS